MAKQKRPLKNQPEDNTSNKSRKQAPDNNENKQPRKQPKKWPTDLHRMFVNAVVHLGGSKAASPAKITALLKVNGLTNDEIKSHLQ
ncbi:Myb-like transcription factor family protein, partial [Tanacetum coccineum]